MFPAKICKCMLVQREEKEVTAYLERVAGTAVVRLPMIVEAGVVLLISGQSPIHCHPVKLLEEVEEVVVTMHILAHAL